jgi:membrane protein YdbS with pleckstrin-like domain
MALVACPECNQQISTDAITCPHCGRPLSGMIGPRGPSWPGVATVGAAAASAPEQSLWEGAPSIALLYGKLLRLIIRCLVLGTIGYFAIFNGLPILASLSSDMRSFTGENANALKLGITAFLILAVIPPVVSLLIAAGRIKNTHYRVTNQRIIIESGLFSRSLEEIDMRSVDDIEFRQSFLERIFRIGEILVVSTDKVAPRLALHGIHDPRNTREMIRTTAYQVTQRQLFTRST